MKKVLAILAVTAAFASPSLAQPTYDFNTGVYVNKPSVPVATPSMGVKTSRGLITDPDAFIRGSIERNYNYYQNLNN